MITRNVILAFLLYGSNNAAVCEGGMSLQQRMLKKTYREPACLQFAFSIFACFCIASFSCRAVASFANFLRAEIFMRANVSAHLIAVFLKAADKHKNELSDEHRDLNSYAQVDREQIAA